MTDSYTLRPATAEDARTIHTLVWNAKLNPSGLKWERFWVAVSSGGEVVACAQVKPHADGTKELASLVVDPVWQGQGLARRLIEHFLALHPGPLYLMCLSKLEAFYNQFGFSTVPDDALPTYFRRVKRLTKIVEFVMQEGDLILVMLRDPHH